jgi:hypothetical protein
VGKFSNASLDESCDLMDEGAEIGLVTTRTRDAKIMVWRPWDATYPPIA